MAKRPGIIAICGMCCVLLASSGARADVWSWLNPDLVWIEAGRTSTAKELQKLPLLPTPQAHEHAGFHSGFAPTADAVRWVQVDLGAELPVDMVVVVPAYFGATSQGEGPYGWPSRFRIEASSDAEFSESVTLLDATREDQPARVAPVVAKCQEITARYVRFTATRLAPQPRSVGRFMFCLGELMVFSGGTNRALHGAVTSTRATDTPPTWSQAHLVDGWSALGIPAMPDTITGNGWHSGIVGSAVTTKWVQVDLGSVLPLDEIRLYPAHPPDFPDRPGFGFPRRFKLECADDPTFAVPHLLVDCTSPEFTNPGDNVVTFPLEPGKETGRYVRLTATELWQRNDDFVFALAEMEVLSRGKNAALQAPVTFLDQTNTGSWKGERLVDGEAAQGRIQELPAWLALLGERMRLETGAKEYEAHREAALVVAYERARWLGGWLAVLATLGGVFMVLGAKRQRRLEMEALRERIARDLHDEVGSHLGSITLASELALRHPGLDAETRSALDEMHRTARQAAESMRGIVWLVREGGEPPLSRLIQALRESATAQLQGVAWTLEVRHPAPDPAASLEFHRHVFLFFKEAVHNIVRHAKPENVRIDAAWDTREFRLSIADDGRGFDPKKSGDGSGLANMKHRAATLHGRMELATIPGGGTTVTLIAPLS